MSAVISDLEKNLKILEDHFLRYGELVYYIENGLIKYGDYDSSFKASGMCVARIFNLRSKLDYTKEYSLYELYKMSLLPGDKFTVMTISNDYVSKKSTLEFARTIVFDGVKTKYKYKTLQLYKGRIQSDYDIDIKTGVTSSYHGTNQFVVFAEIDKFVIDKIADLYVDYIKVEEEYVFNYSKTIDDKIEMRKEYIRKLPNLQENIILEILNKGNGSGITFDKA